MTCKILFVDDEVNVLQGLKRRFRNKFALDTALSGEDGLNMLRSNGPYAVVVSDMQMPGMSGLEFLIKVKAQDLNTIRIMLTGNADQRTASDAVNEGEIFRFLSKPCSHESLSTALIAGIEEYEHRRAHNNQLEVALKDVKNLSERLSYQEIYDQLTNLINRQEFEKRIQKELERLTADHQEHTLLYLDLDQFKVVNDGCGHIGGNELLRQITRLLKKRVRKHDALARIGGDEFGILMEHCPIDQAVQIAERIRTDINQHWFKWDQKKAFP